VYVLYPVAVLRYDYPIGEAFRRVYYICKEHWRVLFRLAFPFSFFMLLVTICSLGVAKIPILGPSVLLVIFQGAYSTCLVLVTLVLYKQLIKPKIVVEIKEASL
jgi:hypothetical protein